MCELMTVRMWRRFGARDSGQDLLEYALIVALIVLVVMTAVSPLGQTIKTVFWDAITTTTSAI